MRQHGGGHGEEPVPVFQSAGGVKASGRFLLLSYHFAPSRAVGALRWRKLATYAARHGYGLDVIALHPDSLGQRDEETLNELPPGTRVFGIPAATSPVDRAMQYALAARRWLMRRFARRRPAAESGSAVGGGSAAMPDSFAWSEIRPIPRSLRELDRLYASWLDYATMGAWAERASRLAIRLAERNAYQAVITCGPPHMAHEAGRLTSKRTGLPLVLDFRDPWSLVQRVPEVIASKLWLRYAKRFEDAALSAASLIVVNTEPHGLALRARYPGLASRILTVTNGFDDESVPRSRLSERFVIAYAGSIYLDRDPRPLMRAAATVVRESGQTPEQFRLAFMGNGLSIAGLNLFEIAAAEGIGDYLDVHPSGTRREALEFLSAATMLVSLPQDSDMAIPSKIFEYMHYDAWLLALAAPNSATALLLEGSGADVVRHDDFPALVAVLRQRYEQHRRGQRPPRLALDRRYSRERQAEILFRAIEEVLRPAPRVESPTQEFSSRLPQPFSR